MSDQDTRTVPRRLEAGRPHAAFRIVVVEGPEKGKTFTLSEAARVLVGTSASCHFALRDVTVSRRHLALRPLGAALEVVDLGSRNGTLANGVAIVHAILWGGERLTIGETTLAVDVTDGVAQARLSDREEFGLLRGSSTAMRRLYALAERLAPTHQHVVIEGETGTGKELLAEELHAHSPRSANPFVVLDARRSVPASALEAAAVEASRGTLVIDELTELGLDAQAALVGLLGARPPSADRVRVLALSQNDPDGAVLSGRLREDLYYRLLEGVIEVPPLRDRAGDVPLLLRHFWATLGGVESPPPSFVARAERSPWPGNVRQLLNAVACEVAGASGLGAPDAPDVRERRDLAAAARFDDVLQRKLPLSAARERVVAEFERAYVEFMLDLHGGNVTKAAAAAGVARRHFQHVRARQRTTARDGE